MTTLAAPLNLQRSPPLAEQIYRSLRYQLRAGAFAPGERLIESALAQKLAVSRSPVREALSRLTADGLLDTHGSGFQVVMPTAKDMAEIFGMRRLLEPPAAREVAETTTPALVSELGAALARAREAGEVSDFPAFTEANYAYRAAWVDRVASRRLRETILRFDDQAGLVRRTTLVLANARADAIAILERLTASFAQGDGASAANASRAFIDAAEDYYRRVTSGLS
jgi:DNA-binding GntR family transcriptional regulator